MDTATSSGPGPLDRLQVLIAEAGVLAAVMDTLRGIDWDGHGQCSTTVDVLAAARQVAAAYRDLVPQGSTVVIEDAVTPMPRTAPRLHAGWQLNIRPGQPQREE